jgi:hypothetical protein
MRWILFARVLATSASRLLERPVIYRASHLAHGVRNDGSNLGLSCRTEENIMANKGPLAIVKERFGDKGKLVEAVKELASEEIWLARTNLDQGGSRGIENVSNAKLLRLHATLSVVKEKFGSRTKLVDAVLALENRVKDTGFRGRLEAYPVPRLYDRWKSLDKRARAQKVAAKADAKA